MIFQANYKKNLTPVVVSWVLVVLWAGFIFFMSAHEGNDLDSGAGLIGWIKHRLTLLAEAAFGQGTDAVSVAAHFLEYMVFGALLTVALVNTRRIRRGECPSRQANWSKLVWTSALIAIVIASLYGVTDEFHQAFVPGRVCDPADWLTDTLGAAFGSSISVCTLRRISY